MQTESGDSGEMRRDWVMDGAYVSGATPYADVDAHMSCHLSNARTAVAV